MNLVRTPSAPRRLLARRALPLLWTLLGCRCNTLEAEIDGQKFVRCAQAAPPKERRVELAGLTLTAEERTLRVEARGPLTIVAFTGPVEEPFSASDLALLAQSRASLALYLGGLGSTPELARANLTKLAALNIPTLFVAGGSDRLSVVEEAFGALDERSAELLSHVSGIRELRFGADRFVIVPGAPFGRYAVDDQACGFTLSDLEDIQKAASASTATRTWLLAWHAPAGFDVSEGFAGVESGSADLRGLALALHARGGIFAYPEGPVSKSEVTTRAWIAPRLGSTGSLRADGSRLPASVVRLSLGPEGLSQLP